MIDALISLPEPGEPHVDLEQFLGAHLPLTLPCQSVAPRRLKFPHRSKAPLHHARVCKEKKRNVAENERLRNECDRFSSEIANLATTQLNVALLGKPHKKGLGGGLKAKDSHFRTAARAAFLRLKQKPKGIGVRHARIVAAVSDLCELRQWRGVQKVLHSFLNCCSI